MEDRVGALIGAHWNNGHPVARMNGVGPGDAKAAARHRRFRRAYRRLSPHDFDRRAGKRDIPIVQHVAHLVETRFGRGYNVTPTVRTDAMESRIGALISAHGNNGHPVARMNRVRPGHGEATARHRRFGRADRHCRQFGFRFGERFRFRGRFRYGFSNLLDGGGELGGILSRQEHSSRVLGDAGEVLVLVSGQIEADDMGGERHALPGKLLRQRARICVTVFDPIRNQNHGRWRVTPREFLGSVLHRCRKRRASQGHDPVDDLLESIAIHRAHRHRRFDVRAEALLTMAIGDKPQIRGSWPGRQQIAHRLPGDLDLGHTVDLAPHGTRGIIDDHHIAGLQCCGGQKRDAQSRNSH